VEDSSRVPTPMDFLRVLVERRVKVQVAQGRELLGIIQGYDEHCNLLLNEVSESVTFRAPDGRVTHPSRSIDLLFVRGDQVITISPT
jgi:U6 snRNA-associated Sm-like protein LSm3